MWMDRTAEEISRTTCITVLIGDENWSNFIPPQNCEYFSSFLCSGKVTTIRHILDKIKVNNNITKFIICFSSNNYDADSKSTIPLLNNIFKASKETFPNSCIVNRHFPL